MKQFTCIVFHDKTVLDVRIVEAHDVDAAIAQAYELWADRLDATTFELWNNGAKIPHPYARTVQLPPPARETDSELER